MERLKRRADFRAAASGMRAQGRTLALQARRRSDGDGVRVGFTVSRQVGNAVERNRVRRRLRELVRQAPAGSLHAGHDYVLLGRRPALEVRFGKMMQELRAALDRIHGREIHGRERQKGGGAGGRPLHEQGSASLPSTAQPNTRQNPRMPEH